MYAVIETGGKQYRVELGSELAVERLDVAPGETVRFERVLLVADGDNAQIGTPVVADALVTGEVLRQDRGEKVIVFKYRPNARHRAKKGHRQEQTVIRVADITFGGRSAASEAGVQESEKAKGRRAATAEAEKKAAADAALADKLAADEAAREAKEAKEEAAAKPATKASPKIASPKTPAKPVAKAKADAPAKPVAKASAAKASTAKSTAAKSTAAKATPAKPAAKPKSTKQSSSKSTSARTKAQKDSD